uniref:Major sperm protein n=1 Tax=Ascaris lumbricoides TaxID=6252 RepID=A0A0M3HR93_ASCLU
MAAFDARHCNKMSRTLLQLAMFCTIFLVVSSITVEGNQSECGVSQICIRDPPDCSPESECKFIATFGRSSDPDQMRLRLYAQNSAQRPYVAIRFSDKRPLVKSTTIYCLPKERILRIGFEHDGRTDFAPRQTSDKLALISNSWAKNHMVECEFDRAIIAPRRMLEAQSLTSPLHVQVFTGGITKDGFPMSPDAAFTSKDAVDFSAVKALPLIRREKSKDKTTAEESIPEEDLASLPEVNEDDIIFDVDGVSIDRKNAPKVIAERWRTKAHRKIADTNSYEEKNSDERYESSIDDEDDESLTWKKKTARKRLGSRKKYGWRSMSGRERSRDVDYAEDELAESSEENLEGETKHKKKRPSGRTKGSRGRKRGKNPSGKSFTIAPDEVFSYDDDEQTSLIEKSDDFNSTNAAGAQCTALCQLGATAVLYLMLF